MQYNCSKIEEVKARQKFALHFATLSQCICWTIDSAALH